MATETEQEVTMDKFLSLAKRRGFLFQSSEIYGGLNATWDYGPLGVELKRNVKDAWWKTVIRDRDDMIGLDSAILMHPKIWEASGHIENFSDPLVECRACHQRFRVDDLSTKVCPDCSGDLTDPRQFNLMFKTFMGAAEDTASEIYLRPETAQGIFVNFENVLRTMRAKIPFGIANIGKSFRNEITPGQFIFRTREFEQMEIEFFCNESDEDEWMDYWINKRMEWYKSLGIKEDQLQLREHEESELAHYAKKTVDIEYLYPWGWGELEGIANRGNYDLSSHQKNSGKDLTYFDSLNDFTPSIFKDSTTAFPPDIIRWFFFGLIIMLV